MYNFKLISPRSQDKEQNEKIFTSDAKVYGIEVTLPQYAARCVVNIDPQHTGGNVNLAAIEESLRMPCPPDGSTLVTVRPDPDSVGTMALFNIRNSGGEIQKEQLMSRVRLIAESDKFSQSCSWEEWKSKSRDETLELENEGIGAICSDFKVPLEERVTRIENWLLTGNCIGLSEAKERIKKEKAEAAAQSKVHIFYSPYLQREIAVVISSHRGATTLGYTRAPVVICVNKKFRFNGGPEHLKYTICQFKEGYINLPELTKKICQEEDKWGGSPTIIGSPQGEPSQLTLGRIMSIVGYNGLTFCPRGNVGPCCTCPDGTAGCTATSYASCADEACGHDCQKCPWVIMDAK